MKPQPSYAQAGSVYYICLLRDELLLHQGKETKRETRASKCFSTSSLSLLKATNAHRKSLLTSLILSDFI